VNRLRNRLILVFLAGTLVPAGAMLWITSALLQQSLQYADSGALDRLSKLLEQTGRQLYQGARDDLKEEAARGTLTPRRFTQSAAGGWPASVQEFWESGENERFSLSGGEGDRLDYYVRSSDGVLLYTRSLGNIRMGSLSEQYRQARRQVEDLQRRDLRKGFTYTLLVLGAAVWIVCLMALAFVAERVSRPIQDLTGGLSELAAGRYETRLRVQGHDEVGRAVQAFNNMAVQLAENRDRLVYLTQVASWQLLARKMAHELKNSLTPIRLTVEEIVARQPDLDAAFLRQATQIVVEEIETLERRVRAFSEFSSEPVSRPVVLDLNEIASERIEFLRVGHLDTEYRVELADPAPKAFADVDHVKGILTNLLENAAEALPGAGTIAVVTTAGGDGACVEVHDSGPGLTEDVRRSLFEPTVSFKRYGMGLGLSISRKNALLAGGDLQVIEGRLGGAGFRLNLPRPPGEQ
jgi:two-component system, NtrC family, nitrogen regulation sensor histidine kinase NtrY